MNRRGFRFLYIFLLAAFMLIFVSCSSRTQNDTTASATTAKTAATDKLVIKGLTDKDIEISTDELKTMKQAEKQATAVDSAGKETDYSIKGPLFDDVLKKYGKSQKDLKGIRLNAGDGYSIEVPEDVLKNRDIILALELNGKELDGSSKPVRAVVPDERAMYWVRNLTNIEILKSVERPKTERIIFIETASGLIPVQDYDYYDSKDKAFKTGDILYKFKGSSDTDNLFLKAADKLEKNETKDNFLKGYIKITGSDSPAFVSDILPTGMHVKNLLWFSYGGDMYFSASKSLTFFSETSIDGKNGVMLQDIVKEAGLTSSDKYVLTGADGYTAEIDAKDLENGLIYTDDKGNVAVYFKDLPKNTNIKGLLSVEIKK